MIKNLLNADEEPPEGTKVIVEETITPPRTENAPAETAQTSTPEAAETRPAFDVSDDAKFLKKETEGEDWAIDESELEAALIEMGIDPHAVPTIENIEPQPAAPLVAPAAGPAPETDIPTSPPENPQSPLEKAEAYKAEREKNEIDAPLFGQTPYRSETTAESIRNSGLAYSAAIVLFGAVVLMMIFGWLVDLLLGTSPWGIVGGILLGGVVGFIQFFRITSSIFKK